MVKIHSLYIHIFKKAGGKILQVNTKVTLKDITLSFKELTILRNFNLTIPSDKITCIIGPSGCGKTSLLNIMSGLITDYTGYVDISSKDIGYIFQEDRLLPWETVYDNIALVKDDVDEDLILSILDTLQLKEFKDMYPHQLSGGMRQRVSLARGFYFEPKILLLDEPFKSLDYDLKMNLLQFFITYYVKNPITVCLVSHDIDEAILLAHKIVVLSKNPTAIMEEIEIDTCPSNRKIDSEEHSLLRKKIIKMLI